MIKSHNSYDKDILNITFMGWLVTAALLLGFWAALEIGGDKLYIYLEQNGVFKTLCEWLNWM